MLDYEDIAALPAKVPGDGKNQRIGPLLPLRDSRRDLFLEAGKGLRGDASTNSGTDTGLAGCLQFPHVAFG